MTNSLTSRTLQGLKWSYLALAFNIVLQIGFTAAMARLIAPSAYGLVAMALVLVRFGNHLALLGVGPALIQKKELSSEDIGTAYLMAGFMGLLLFGCCWAAAPFAGQLFLVDENPELVRLIRIGAVLLFIGPLTSVSVSLLRREMRFKLLGGMELGCFVVGVGCVGLPMAIGGYGPLALIVGPVAQALLLCLLAAIIVRRKIHRAFSFQSCKNLFSFGGRYSLVGFLEMLTYSVDIVIISRFVDASLVGIYNRASFLIQIPAQHLASVVNKVGFASFSEAARSEDSLQRGYLSALTFFGILLFPFCLGVAIAAPEIVSVLLGPQWVDAAPILKILALGVPFHLALHLGGLVFDVSGRLWLKLAIRGVHLVFIVLMYFSFSGYGLIGFALAFTITEVLFYVVYSTGIMVFAKIDIKSVLSRHWAIACLGGPTAAAIWLAAQVQGITDLPVPLILLLEIMAGISAMAICLVFFPAAVIRREIAFRFFGNGQEIDAGSAIRRLIAWYGRRLEALEYQSNAQNTEGPGT